MFSPIPWTLTLIKGLANKAVSWCPNLRAWNFPANVLRWRKWYIPGLFGAESSLGWKKPSRGGPLQLEKGEASESVPTDRLLREGGPGIGPQFCWARCAGLWPELGCRERGKKNRSWPHAPPHPYPGCAGPFPQMSVAELSLKNSHFLPTQMLGCLGLPSRSAGPDTRCCCSPKGAGVRVRSDHLVVEREGRCQLPALLAGVSVKVDSGVRVLSFQPRKCGVFSALAVPGRALDSREEGQERTPGPQLQPGWVTLDLSLPVSRSRHFHHEHFAVDISAKCFRHITSWPQVNFAIKNRRTGWPVWFQLVASWADCISPLMRYSHFYIMQISAPHFPWNMELLSMDMGQYAKNKP